MKSSLMLTCAVLASSTAVLAGSPNTIEYVLPQTVVAAAVKQQLISCPASAAEQAADPSNSDLGKPNFNYVVGLTATAVPQRLVVLNVDSGFLVDRETKLHFAEGWALKDFNGKATGQGGQVLVSLIKAGAAVAAISAGVPVPMAPGLAPGGALSAPGFVPPVRQRQIKRWFVVCKPGVTAKLDEIDRLKRRVETARDQIVAGSSSAAVQAVLTEDTARIAELQSDLSITYKLPKALKPQIGSAGAPTGLAGKTNSLEVPDWFMLESALVDAKRGERDQAKPSDLPQRVASFFNEEPGAHGFQVVIKPNQAFQKMVACPTGEVGEQAKCIAEIGKEDPYFTRDLIYRRPVPAKAVLYPIRADCTDDICPEPDGWGENASGDIAIGIPQFSRLYRLKTGASIFRGRTVGAEFGPLGEPTMLQYDIGGGAKDLSSVIDASTAAAQTVRDADLNAVKRRVDEMKAEQELRDLLKKQAEQATDN